MGIANYEISWKNSEKEHLNAWSVYDRDKDVHFEVYPVTYSSGDYIPTFSSGLGDDYSIKLVDKLCEDLPDNIVHMVSKKESNVEQTREGYFMIYYENKEDLVTSCKVFWGVAEEIRERCEFPIYFQIIRTGNNASENPNHYEHGNYNGHIGPIRDTDKRYIIDYDDFLNSSLLAYYYYGYTYQDKNVLEEMTEEDIAWLIRVYPEIVDD